MAFSGACECPVVLVAGSRVYLWCKRRLQPVYVVQSGRAQSAGATISSIAESVDDVVLRGRKCWETGWCRRQTLWVPSCARQYLPPRPLQQACAYRKVLFGPALAMAPNQGERSLPRNHHATLHSSKHLQQQKLLVLPTMQLPHCSRKLHLQNNRRRTIGPSVLAWTVPEPRPRKLHHD